MICFSGKKKKTGSYTHKYIHLKFLYTLLRICISFLMLSFINIFYFLSISSQSHCLNWNGMMQCYKTMHNHSLHFDWSIAWIRTLVTSAVLSKRELWNLEKTFIHFRMMPNEHHYITLSIQSKGKVFLFTIMKIKSWKLLECAHDATAHTFSLHAKEIRVSLTRLDDDLSPVIMIFSVWYLHSLHAD